MSVPSNMSADEQRGYDEARKRIEQCRLEKGTMLNLGGLGLTTLPPEIAQLTALTTLDLFANLLITLPPEIGQLTALSKLYLEANRLTTLPPEIAQLTALSKLYLQNNQLTTLPPEIAKLTALTTLNISKNRFTTLPPEIRQLKKLKGLYLHDNPALRIPPEILGPTREKRSDQNPPANPRAVLCAQKRCTRHFGNAFGSAAQKPSAPSPTASSGPFFKRHSLRNLTHVAYPFWPAVTATEHLFSNSFQTRFA